MKNQLIYFLFIALVFSCQTQKEEKPATVEFTSNSYEDLVSLFKEWRAFEKPPTLDGAPDYTAESFNKRTPRFQELQTGLQQIDTANWPIENKVDWMRL